MENTQTYINDFSRPARERNVIVCMDGTWNDETGKDGDSIITNISKLYKSLDVDSEAQISRYFRGVGSDEENTHMGTLIGGAMGRSEQRIRNHAYATIAKEYRNGDRLFIFGFSRGAASARMLASQLHKEGIPENITITTAPQQNHVTKQVENRFVRYQSEGEVRPVEVAFLGVWDTVYAFGIPVKFLGIPFHRWDLFKDKHVSPNVSKAVHLVSIDETRSPFEPTLMNHKPGVVEEVWVPGVHADVGGGYAEDEIGRITLKYMLDTLNAYTTRQGLLPVRFHEPTLQGYLEIPAGGYHFHFHGLGYKKGMRTLHVLENDAPCALPPRIHASVYALQQSAETYSVVEERSGKKKYRIQYNPPNLKALQGKCEVA